VQLGQLDSHGRFARRGEPIDAEAEGDGFAGQCHLNQLAADAFGFAVQQVLDQAGGAITAACGAACRIARRAFGETPALISA
jgi:hypothetical protein